jgi:microcystin-dependent protein
VMKEASATRLTSTFFGGNSTVLGAVGGSESTTLTLAQLPTGITSSGSNTINVTSTTAGTLTGTVISDATGGGPARELGSDGANQAIASSGVNTINVTSFGLFKMWP